MLKSDLKEFDQKLESIIKPRVQDIENQEAIAEDIIQALASLGLFGLTTPREYGGTEIEYSDVQAIHELLGKYHSSVQNMVAVNSMVGQVILKCGSKEHKDAFLSKLASAELMGAFALTEPNIGSDVYEIETTVEDEEEKEGFVINGRKKWITLAQIADFFLVFAKYGNGHGIFIVEKERPGLTINRIQNILGLRGNMLAEVQFDHCRIPKGNALCIQKMSYKIGMSFAFQLGRFLTACGCLGLIRSCVESSLKYSRKRKQFGVPLSHHQLIQKKIAAMVTEYNAAKLLCSKAGEMLQNNDNGATQMILMAKYYASKAANSAAAEAVQIHGANGVSCDFDVARNFRDAKIMELIEGSTEMHEQMIAKGAFRAGYENI